MTIEQSDTLNVHIAESKEDELLRLLKKRKALAISEFAINILGAVAKNITQTNPLFRRTLSLMLTGATELVKNEREDVELNLNSFDDLLTDSANLQFFSADSYNEYHNYSERRKNDKNSPTSTEIDDAVKVFVNLAKTRF